MIDLCKVTSNARKSYCLPLIASWARTVSRICYVKELWAHWLSPCAGTPLCRPLPVAYNGTSSRNSPSTKSYPWVVPFISSGLLGILDVKVKHHQFNKEGSLAWHWIRSGRQICPAKYCQNWLLGQISRLSFRWGILGFDTHRPWCAAYNPGRQIWLESPLRSYRQA